MAIMRNLIFCSLFSIGIHGFLILGMFNFQISNEKVNFSKLDYGEASIKIRLSATNPKKEVVEVEENKSENEKFIKKEEKNTKELESSSAKEQNLDSGQNSLVAKYLSAVRVIIASNKYKSRLAKRLKLKGKVKLQFMIKKPSEISGLKVTGTSGHKLLDKSAIDSVLRSAPFPRMPDEIDMEELPIDLEIEYH